MERNNQSESTALIEYQELIKQTAYHEAGHAAAIYLHNKKNELPPVFFEIVTKEHLNPQPSTENESNLEERQFTAKIEGGRLIQDHPASLLESGIDFTQTEHQAYLAAYQADVINLLVGPLAEAKYVALRDDESLNPLLINSKALKFYGGSSDLKSVYEYLDHFIKNNLEREQKLSSLFNMAFLFINDKTNWKAIETLASYILINKNRNISCEEVSSVLDNCSSSNVHMQTIN